MQVAASSSPTRQGGVQAPDHGQQQQQQHEPRAAAHKSKPSMSSVLSADSTRARGRLGTAGRPPHHRQALSAIRAFLRRESCFDILPESFRLIVFDNKLTIKRALVALQANGIVSAPLYDSQNYRFAGMFTVVDVIHLIQYYYLSATGYDNAAFEVESLDFSALRDIEVAIDVPPPPIISVHPDDQLYTACAALVRTHARRLPLIDRDPETDKETIVSVLTQYRVLKFIAINCAEECARLTESIGTLGVGTYLSSFAPDGVPISSRQGPSHISSSSRRPRARSFLPTPSQRHTSTLTSTASHPEEGLPPNLTPPSSVAPSTSDHSAGSSTVSTPPPEDASGNTTETEEESVAGQGGTSGPQSGTASTRDSPTPTNSANTSPRADRFHPLATATLQTTVFDVVHLFSDLGISAVPIVDNETGQVINLYEAVDVVDLVRSNAYQVLDLTIEDALYRRSKDFPGVVTCTPEDSLASILAYVREKRAHRFVIVEGEDETESAEGGEAKEKKVPGRLVGVLCLSDILKYIVGSSSLSGMRVVGLGFRSEEEGLAIPRVVDDEELDEINEGISGLGINNEQG